ncbi:hypothetical protein S4054249_21325 [Pseudoalteromonas luteoviolacea]|uniref:Uncharacterized protein n=1 Tax=Pseudoalteromonas luteoviolacea S4054 TaxID=1129367 RepID=A0A0F6A8J9_9GAMM|nr:hypothetical protein S4054249_21325 [Pseudoalteromonas luteoviolacea]AOT15515.1 hypothetical protein S40542_22265 [Pseudoalteromonas luteoviolacea]AOT20234.1 hypothetical protein S4054_21240 [Pseudoalteromonas luteoviolacea]KKE82181.1 hypothetical protein N479_19450 [Pseudoalteromonas luteoviolacea S4054]KZN69703.1 hypothetical protein N481_21885 [Pseudoalteromonas luteoviolacea S4047-1]
MGVFISQQIAQSPSRRCIETVGYLTPKIYNAEQFAKPQHKIDYKLSSALIFYNILHSSI